MMRMMPKISVSPMEMKQSSAASASALRHWVTTNAVGLMGDERAVTRDGRAPPRRTGSAVRRLPAGRRDDVGRVGPDDFGNRMGEARPLDGLDDQADLGRLVVALPHDELALHAGDLEALERLHQGRRLGALRLLDRAEQELQRLVLLAIPRVGHFLQRVLEALDEGAVLG